MTELRDIMALAQLRLSGCPAPLVLDAMKQAAVEFCRRTGAWTEAIALEIAEADLDEGDDGKEWTLTLPTGAAVLSVVSILDDEGEDSGLEATFEQPDTLVFPSLPADGDYTVKMRCAPSGSQIPDWLAEQHGRALCDGACAVLMAEAGRPWANPGLVPFHRQAFMAEVDNLRLRVLARYRNSGYGSALDGLVVV